MYFMEKTPNKLYRTSTLNEINNLLLDNQRKYRNGLRLFKWLVTK